MTDEDKALVERLYEQADRKYGSVGSLRSVEWEAADRIEELQADNAKLRAALLPFARHVGKVDALVTLKIGVDTWTGH